MGTGTFREQGSEKQETKWVEDVKDEGMQQAEAFGDGEGLVTTTRLESNVASI